MNILSFTTIFLNFCQGVKKVLGHSYIVVLLVTFFAYPAIAKVTLPSLFSANMVLQQKADVAIWGKASANKVVLLTCSWTKQKYVVQSNASGDFQVTVKTPKYGGPYFIVVSDGEAIKLDNILIGEVWVCSGQSNMEMPLAGWGKVTNYESEIAKANFKNIRLLQANHVTSNLPTTDFSVTNGGWTVCSPKSVAEFSSTAYFFAREIYQKTGVPIGLIHTSWGGTVAEAWTSASTLNQMPDFKQAVHKIQESALQNKELDQAQLQKKWEERVKNADAGFKNESYIWTKENNGKDWQKINIPSLWENSVLPNFDGVVYLNRTIEIPPGLNAQDAKLNLGEIDDQDITFFDGQIIGSTDGYNQKRTYTIPSKLLTPGTHYLSIRIFDGGGEGGLYGDAKNLYIDLGDGQKKNLAGDWSFRVGMSLRDVGPSPASQQGPNRPTVLFNAMINPLLKFKIRGVIWYQGESNAERAKQYQTLFPNLIKDWRTQFSSGDFPFFFVQLANFRKRVAEPTNSAWAELREAQLKTLSVPNTGMAVAIDIGDANDIHPKNKQDVGKRLAYIALAKVYAQANAYSGPLYQAMQIKGKQIELSFQFAKGLKVNSGTLKGFAIAGEDKIFHWATAEIVGDKVVVQSDAVAKPIAVRYGWADNPDVNLVNHADLPASPFRTDSW